MAIRATVSFRSVHATATHRNLSIDASLVPALGNQVSFQKLVAVANWKNLYLHDVHVNAERTIYLFDDQFAFNDAAVFAVTKSVSDQVGFLSADPVFVVGKVLSDDFSFSDFARTHAGKVEQDSVSLLDVNTFSVGKLASDNFSFTENVHTLLTFIRQFNSPVSVVDAHTVSFGKATSDNFNFADETTTHPNKGIFDTQSFSESQTFNVGKGILEPAFILDNLTITRQPNNFVFNELSGVVTVTGEPSDSLTVSEDISSFVVSKTLQDFFTLDDFAQIDKNVEGVKTNVIGLTETLEFDHLITSSVLNKSLMGNMVLNA